ncbi:MAG: glycosyltransferase, partial [Sulfuricella sp.]
MVDNKKIVLHVGCGPVSELTFHPHFKRDEWREIRLDIDPDLNPDIVASLTDMRVVPSGSMDAVWSSHNVEHLFPHQVPTALREFLRVLKPGGFALITLPDLQAIAGLVVADKLDDVAYYSPGGPIAAHDMIYGWRAETQSGNDFMCHRTGFTAKTLYWALIAAGFAEVLVQRDGHYALWATAYKQRPAEPKALAGIDSEIYVPEQSEQLTTGYHIWQDQHRPTAEHKTLCEQRIRSWHHSPRIHLALLLAQPDDQFLAASIGSLARQYYMTARVTVVAPFAPSAEWRDNDRLCWHVAGDDLLLAANRVLSEFDADWVGVADGGDQFAPHAFFALAEAALSHPDWRLVYSDEDRINNVGARDLPHFKPDFNPALLRSYPYVGGLSLIDQKLFRQLGGFDGRFLGVEEYDLALRVLEQAGAAAFGHVADLLYHRLTDGGHCNLPVSALVEKGRAALAAHLERQGVGADVVHGVFPASYRVRYRVAPEVSASVLIVADSNLAHLQRCVESVLEQTAWPNYELVVLADAAAGEDVRVYVAALGGLGEPRIRAVLADEALAWSEARNRLAAASLGEFLVFLHSPCAVMQADWLEELLGRANQSGVAAVGPRLLKPDGKVHQAGAILGLDNRPVSSPFSDEALEYPGYYGRALVAQNFSALPEACLVIRHSVFAASGGFDAHFAGDLAAADLSLRLTQGVDRLEWTPFVSLLHSGQALAGNAPAD